MTSQPSSRQAPAPALAKLKPLPFAFPFLRKRQGQSEASAQFTDEHEIYRLLAKREPSGSYLVSRKGMWHGGIHVTEAGAGQSLDLEAGLRCIADGVVIAFRANKTYPISEIAATDGGSPIQAPYSTGFALVRHTMEFPRGTKLTFYSLYMHLMSWEDYANFPQRKKPSYWSREWRVTQHAQDKPSPGRNGQIPDPSQQGLRVRKTPNGAPIGILPQGASIRIGKRKKVRGREWGEVTDLLGASMYPPVTGGYVDPSSDVGRWVYLGQENGGPMVEEVFPDSMFDGVIVTTGQTLFPSNSQGDGGGIPIKSGDLIGHLGRYDSLDQRTSGTRMAHIEVFCDDGIESFIEQGREWVGQHGPHKEDWAALGLPSESTILRVAPGTVLYQRTQNNEFVPGTDPQSRKTDAVQVYSLAELARDPKRRIPEPRPNPDPGYPVSWWHVDGVNAQGQLIDGWVCDFNFAGGRVTREFAQKWIDFECLADDHDPAHTIFATTQKWGDYARGADIADLAARSNLSPLMLKVYDALFTTGDGAQAAVELCMLSQTERGGYPWLMQAASRLIVKHESEWANPSKWNQLIVELEKKTEPNPQHGEERKRIEMLAWWDEVKAGVPGFPGPEVFHFDPIGVVSNFLQILCIPLQKAKELALTITSGFEGATAMDFGAVADNGDGQGMSFGVIQWAAGQGTLGPLLERMRSADLTIFQEAFDESSNYRVLESAISGGDQQTLVDWALNQQAHNPSWKRPFKKLGEVQTFQQIQIDEATRGYHSRVMQCVQFLRTISPDLIAKVELATYCAFFDLAVQQGSLKKAAQQIQKRVSEDHPDSQGALIKIAVEERAKTAARAWVADCFSRRIGILQQNTYTYSAYGRTSRRANSNFHLISKDASAYVCGI
ncbi:glycoside hydrolase family 19 protein [Burkholderia stagnalis]|uniref:glycoside hydrolase family 19 protein n=1 Tax=Burkholderia stagnalis TaxID=1503054 RepID=UPI000AE0AE0A|nr:glycoside hydrolase family 19 protein [Burkholderia stagnalis]